MDGMEEERKVERGRPPFSLEGYRFSREILDDDSIPDSVKKALWAFGDKEMTLSNLSEGDIKKLLMKYDDAVTAYLMSMTDYDYSFDLEKDLTQLRPKVELKLRRSKSGFEREMLATEISRIKEEPIRKEGGILRRLGGFLGMKR